MAENRPKPGSLRDRIKAFESQNQNKSDSAPPPPRPKPSHLTRNWKPVQTTPSHDTTEEDEKAKERAGAGGGMSASDAKESIQSGGFGSLKERMAALQGKGAFGGAGAGGPTSPPIPAPASRPAPPKKVASPPTVEGDEEHEGEPSGEVEIEGVGSPSDETSDAQPPTSQSPGQETKESPEDDEQARRAAIAARMARLGGTRIGMAPPVLGKKPPPPPVKRPSADIQEDSRPGAEASVSKAPPTGLSSHSSDQPENTAEGVTSPSRIPLPTSPPVTSPPPNLLVGPKRAAPPRKKRPTPTSVPALEKEIDPMAEAGAPVASLQPQEVALPPSRSTTLDVEKVISPESEGKKEDEEDDIVTPPAPAAASSAEPSEPLGHARLHSLAIDSLADTEEIATPPPRSVTPSEGDEEIPLDSLEEDPMASTQAVRSEDDRPPKSLEIGDIDERRVPGLDAVPTPPLHEAESRTPTRLAPDSSMRTISPVEAHETTSQIASRADVEGPMEAAQLTSEHPQSGKAEKAEEKAEEKVAEREEGMS